MPGDDPPTANGRRGANLWSVRPAELRVLNRPFSAAARTVATQSAPGRSPHTLLLGHACIGDFIHTGCQHLRPVAAGDCGLYPSSHQGSLSSALLRENRRKGRAGSSAARDFRLCRRRAPDCNAGRTTTQARLTRSRPLHIDDARPSAALVIVFRAAVCFTPIHAHPQTGRGV